MAENVWQGWLLLRNERVSWLPAASGLSWLTDGSLPVSSRCLPSLCPNCLFFFFLNFIRTSEILGASLVAQLVRIHLQCRRPGFDPWVGKILWKREWRPTPVFLPGESHGQKSLAAAVHEVTKSQTPLKRLNTHTPDILL